MGHCNAARWCLVGVALSATYGLHTYCAIGLHRKEAYVWAYAVVLQP